MEPKKIDPPKALNEEISLSLAEALRCCAGNTYILQTADRAFYALPLQTWEEVKDLVPASIALKALVLSPAQAARPSLAMYSKAVQDIMSSRRLPGLDFSEGSP